MIEDKDCCDNCIEGVEPCCDEELQQQIEEQIVTEGVTTDIDELARHLCCQTKFYIIYKAMDGLSNKDLVELRNRLREYMPDKVLHPHLEAKFNQVIK